MRKLADTGMFEGKEIKALAIGGPIVAGTGSGNVHSVASVAQNDIAPLTVRRGLIGNAVNRVPIFARRQAAVANRWRRRLRGARLRRLRPLNTQHSTLNFL